MDLSKTGQQPYGTVVTVPTDVLRLWWMCGLALSLEGCWMPAFNRPIFDPSDFWLVLTDSKASGVMYQ